MIVIHFWVTILNMTVRTKYGMETCQSVKFASFKVTVKTESNYIVEANLIAVKISNHSQNLTISSYDSCAVFRYKKVFMMLIKLQIV